MDDSEAARVGQPIEKKAILRSLAGETLDRPPIWLMRQAGRYLPEYRKLRAEAGDFLSLCFNPRLAIEVTLQPIRRFALDAAILFSDILVVPYGLGQNLSFQEGEGPVLEPIRSVSDLHQLSVRSPERSLAPIYEAVAGIAAALPSSVALIGFAGAPWTVATYMVEGGTSRDFQAVRLWAYREPDGFAILIDHIVSATIEHLSAQIVAGAELVQLFDSWAGVLPEAAFRRWVIEPTCQVVAALRQRHPGIPIIGFPRGAGMMAAVYFRETGVTAIGLDTTVSLGYARDSLQSLGPVQGNLDPLALVAGDASLDQGVDDILAHLRHGPFIFNLGHGVVPQTPPEHVGKLIERIRR